LFEGITQTSEIYFLMIHDKKYDKLIIFQNRDLQDDFQINKNYFELDQEMDL